MYIRFMLQPGKIIVPCGSFIDCELFAWTQIKAL